MEFDPRQIQILIAYPIFISIVVYILYAKILTKSETYISKVLSLFYICTIASLILNIIYSLLPIDPYFDGIIEILYYITITLVYGGGIYLTGGTFLLYRKLNGKEQKSKIVEIIMVLIFYSLTIPTYFIFNGIDIGATTDNIPKWNPFFLLYYYSIIVTMIYIPVSIFVLKIRSFFKNNDIRLMKKWNFFIYGWAALVIATSSIFLNYIVPQPFLYYTSVVGIILGIILVGYSFSECKK